MKAKQYLLPAIGVMLLLNACKKDGNNGLNNLLPGKWYVSKMYVKQQITALGHIAILDTTYVSNSFTIYDYFMLQDDSVASISGNGIFYPGPDLVKSTAIAVAPYIYIPKMGHC